MPVGERAIAGSGKRLIEVFEPHRDVSEFLDQLISERGQSRDRSQSYNRNYKDQTDAGSEATTVRP